MLIKLSNQTYINPDKITCITERPHYGEAQAYWVVTFDGENNLVLSQAHFDELMACLPTPVEASKIVEAKQATDTPEIQAYNLMIRALGGQP